MAGITIEQAQAKLTAWLAADSAVASGQEYEIWDGDMRRRLKRADAAVIRSTIDYWDSKVKQLTPRAGGGRRRTRYVVLE